MGGNDAASCSPHLDFAGDITGPAVLGSGQWGRASMSNRQHERRVCEAVIHVMEAHRGLRASDKSWPEDEQRTQEAIDCQFRLGDSRVVMEHTRIESFPGQGQIEDDVRFVRLLGPLERTLSSALPIPGHYVLVVAPKAVAGVRDAGHLRRALEQWVRLKAPTLVLGSPATAPRHFVREVPPGVPFEVALYRFPDLDGQFMIARAVPEDLESERRARIQTALAAKCPKLQSAKGSGFTSALVLESDDIALGNQVEIAEAVVVELHARHGDVPDEVYLVNTATEMWSVWLLRRSPHLFPHVARQGPYYVDPKSMQFINL